MKIETVTIDLPGYEKTEVDLWRHVDKMFVSLSWLDEYDVVGCDPLKKGRHFWMDKHYDVYLKTRGIKFVFTKDETWGLTLNVKGMKKSWGSPTYGNFQIQSVHAKAGVVVRRHHNDDEIIHFFEMMTEW